LNLNEKCIIAEKFNVFIKMGKVNKVTSYQNLTPELLELLHKKYPDGYQNHVIKVTPPNNVPFYAVTLDTADISYLVKVPVKIDTNPDDFDEKDYGDSEDETAAPEGDFEAEDSEEADNIADMSDE
jgi:hypothetical protein